MRPDERSRDVFEEIPGYAKPPLPPLPEVDDYASLARQNFIRATPAARRILDAALRAVGYPAFHATLPERVEDLLRRTNMRQGRLFAPVFSATEALADDPRAIGALERAATLVVAAHAFCHDVMSGRLTQDTHRGEPLEMGQYPNLFSTIALVEGRPRLFKGKRFDRVGVMVRRRCYVLDLGAPGETTVADVAEALAKTVEHARAQPDVDDDDATAIVSAAKTPTVKAALREMEARPESAEALAALRECFVVLCLDLDARPDTHADAAILTQAANPANRWYLASFQLVVFGNAKASAMFSFLAYLDGNVMGRAAAEICKRAAAAPLEGGTRRPLPPPRPLAWGVSPPLARRAWAELRRVQDTQRATFVIDHVGREVFRSCGLDPVGAFVAALAIATRRRAGRTSSIMQLVSVSKYRCVPVGAAMVTTPEIERFVEHAVEGRATRAMLEAAIHSHARECRAERERLSLRWPLEAFLRTRRGASKALTLCVAGGAALALALTRSLGKKDVVISHPLIYPEIAVVGRPGVRLPYVNHFGLHYQIYPREIVLTFMPGLRWKTPNAVFAKDIERALHDVLAVASPPE